MKIHKPHSKLLPRGEEEMERKTKVAIATVLIVALIFGLFAFGETIFGDNWTNFWRTVFSKPGDYAGISLTVTYKDGSTKTFEGDSYSLLPLKISDAGGSVKEITAAITISATFEEESRAWAVEGSWSVKILQGIKEVATMGAPNTAYGGVGSLSYYYSTPTAFVSGEKYTINAASIKYGATQIEYAIPIGYTGPSYGDYTLIFSTSLTLAITSTSNESGEKTADAQANWNFKYSKPEITSLSIEIYNGQIR